MLFDVDKTKMVNEEKREKELKKNSQTSLVWQEKAKIIPTLFLVEKNKYYYPFIEMSSLMDDPYLGYLYYDYPILTIISGERGIGKTSLLANKYVNSVNPKMCFIFNKDEYSLSLSSFLKQLLYKVEEILSLTHTNYSFESINDEKDIGDVFLKIFQLFIDNNFKGPLEVYVDNADEDFLSFLLNIQFKYLSAFKEKYYEKFPLRFFVIFNNDVVVPPICPMFDVSSRLQISRQEKADIKTHIISKIADSYKLNLSINMINSIVQKEDSSSPLYLKIIIHRLAFDKRYFNGEINEDHLVNVINNLPSKTIDLIAYLMDEVATLIGGDDMYKVLFCIGFSFKKVNKEDIKNIFSYMKWDFKDDVFDDVINLIGVISMYSEYTDTFYMDVIRDENSFSYLIIKEIHKRGLFKYLGSLSNYYMAKEDGYKYCDIILKLAFVRIDIALNDKNLDDEILERYMYYLLDVFNFVLDAFHKQNLGEKYTAIKVAEIISWAISKGFSKAILMFVGFANNFVSRHNEYIPLFKAFFYYMKTDYSSYNECKKVVDLFDLVFDQIEKTKYFGNYNNDFALWLKINFTIIKVKYFSISSFYSAKNELDNLVNYLKSQQIEIPTFYMMQIYCTYLIIAANSKDSHLLEDIFKGDILSYFNFNDPNNLHYLRKENLETIYKAKVYSLIALAYAKCYGDDKKNTFVPLVDKACEIFELYASDYELTHFNSTTFSALLSVESLATPMYKKDPFTLYNFRYDARKYYPNSYFVLEAEASYYYWKLMMEQCDDKREIYLKYLTRRRALAINSNLLEAYRLYILVYADFMEYVQDRPNIKFEYHLNKFFEAFKTFFDIAKKESDILDTLLPLGQFYESCRIHNCLYLAEKMNDMVKTKFNDQDDLFKNILAFLYKYYVLEEEVGEEALELLQTINSLDNNEKYIKIKFLFSYWDI